MAKKKAVTQPDKTSDAKKFLLSKLHKRRDRIKRDLAEVTRRITEVSGKPGGRAGGKPHHALRRLENEQPLSEVIKGILAPTISGYTLADISAKVLETGHKTTSSRFINTVYQCLYHDDQFVCDPVTRCWKLK